MNLNYKETDTPISTSPKLSRLERYKSVRPETLSIPTEMFFDSKLTVSETIIYCLFWGLSQHGKNKIEISLSEIEGIINYSEKTAQRAIVNLEKLNLITITRKDRSSSVYTVLPYTSKVL